MEGGGWERGGHGWAGGWWGGWLGHTPATRDSPPRQVVSVAPTPVEAGRARYLFLCATLAPVPPLSATPPPFASLASCLSLRTGNILYATGITKHNLRRVYKCIKKQTSHKLLMMKQSRVIRVS